ncbi:tumor necrosis factor receptor superfamily member 6-like isoform X2 [Haliotis cracherodii]|uniref:tumor necrosis factor receptor superfamily member 6-like isoform X2 n=1 Tax=Haliotis cracherodii TaxID=6455 RepID=UPI0039E98C22
MTFLCSGVWVLLSILVHSSISTVIRDTPNLGTYTHDGVTCFQCPPGTYVDRHCTGDFTYSVCNDCPVGTFQTHYSQATGCSPCQTFCRHDDKMEVVENCTSTHDLKCQCKRGYYLMVVNKFLNTKMCKAFTTCPDGQVVLRNDTTKASTEVVTRQDLQSNDGADITTIVIPVVCLFAIAVTIVLLVLRLTGQRGKTTIHSDDSPLIQRAFLTNPNSSRKQRTLSGSSISSVRSESIFPDMRDKDVWRNEVFTLLSSRLGTDWKRFMRKLPGNKDYHSTINSRCDQIQQEEANDVREQIYKALNEWSLSNEDDYVKIDSVLDTLYDMYESDQTLYNDVRILSCRLATREKTNTSEECV